MAGDFTCRELREFEAGLSCSISEFEGTSILPDPDFVRGLRSKLVSIAKAQGCKVETFMESRETISEEQ